MKGTAPETCQFILRKLSIRTPRHNMHAHTTPARAIDKFASLICSVSSPAEGRPSQPEERVIFGREEGHEGGEGLIIRVAVRGCLRPQLDRRSLLSDMP